MSERDQHQPVATPTPVPGAGADAPGVDHSTLLERLNRRRQRLWRRVRRTVRIVVGVPLAVGLVLLALSRSPLVRMVVASRIQGLTGCTLEADKAYIDLGGRLVLRNMRMLAPGVPGDAARVLHAEEAFIDLDWSGVLSARVLPVAVRLERPTVLLSQSTKDGSLNLAAVPMTGAGAAAQGVAGTVPPEISVNNATIVFAEHDEAGTVSELKRLVAAGSLLPIRAGKPVFAVALTQVQRERLVSSESRAALVLDGLLDLASGTSSLHLRNIKLDDWSHESAPTAYRDIWRRLNVRGDVSRVDLSATPASGVVVELALAGVSMSALAPAQPDSDTARGATPELGLRGVSGFIRVSRSGVLAELDGQIEGQAGVSRVKLRTQGLELTAPLTCEIRSSRIKVAKDPAFLSYVPRTVRQYFEYFSGPTADVDVVATIARGSPSGGEAAPVSVTGTLAFRNGTAAFHKFPYPFHDMSGTVRFDETRIIIDQIRGRGITGAALSAQGIISPINDDAMVDVTINVARLPIDEHLIKAMPPDRRRVVETLFDKTQHAKLLAEGAIRLPNELGIDGTRYAPPCPLGGECDLTVRVQRELGPKGEWITDIDTRFREVGVVVRQFPLPLIGRDVRLRITDVDARIERGDFVGPRGGKATIGAEVLFFENGERVLKPEVRIDVTDLPADDLLVRAITNERAPAAPASPQAPAPGSATNISAKDILSRVELGGAIDAYAIIRPMPSPVPGEEPDIGYDVTARLDGLRAVPLVNGAFGGLALSEFIGTLRLTPFHAGVENLQARLVRTTGPSGPIVETDFVGPVLPAGAADAGHIVVSLDAVLAGPESGRLGATVQVGAMNLHDPIEDVVGVLSPEASTWLRDQRARRDPVGLIDATVRAGQRPGQAAPDINVSLRRARGVELGVMGGRLGVDMEQGSLLLTAPGQGLANIRASGAEALLRWNAEPAGAAVIDGLLSIDGTSGRLSGAAGASIALNDWRFDSPIVPPLLASVASEDAARRYRELKPGGVFDMQLRITGEDGADPAIAGELRPRSLGIQRGEQRVEFESVRGVVRLQTLPLAGGVRGELDDMVGSTASWTARVTGTFQGVREPGPAGSARLDVDFGLSVEALAPDQALFALVPASVRSALKELDVTIAGPVALRESHLGGAIGGSGQKPLTFTGIVDFADAKLDIGLSVDRMAGELRVDVESPGADAPDRVQLELVAPRLRAAGLAVQDLRLIAATGDRPGSVDIERFSAACHAGRIVGSAALDAAGQGPDGARRTFRVDATASGVAFAPLLEELSVTGAVEPLVGPMPDPARDPDVSRGRLDARLSLSGVTGDVRSRVGRGAVRIAHGDVLRLPVILPMMQLSNLVLPSEDRLRALEAEFHVAGRRAVFERVVASGGSIALHGSGVLTWPDLGLDFSFNSKSAAPIPVLSGLIELVRDELVSTQITGTLKDPKVKSQSLSGIRRMFAGMFPGPDPEDRPSDAEVGSAALADQGRLRRPGGHDFPTAAPSGVTRAEE